MMVNKMKLSKSMTMTLFTGLLSLSTAPLIASTSITAAPWVCQDSHSSECTRWYELHEVNEPAACNTLGADETCNRWYSADEVYSPSAMSTLYLKNVHFAFDKAEIRSSSKPGLKRYAKILKKNPDAKVKIIGYTDSKGTENYNHHLSHERAESIRNFLVKNDVRPNQVILEGRGESHPVASNSTLEGRAKNRRSEIKIVNKTHK